jgi:pyrroloquinoline quinone (PQQ) biosynthesis protein C
MSDEPLRTRTDGERQIAPPLPVEGYLAELDRFIAAHDPFRQDRVIPAIGRGTASREVVQRVALELYHLGKWMTPELALLIANAPDAYAFTMDDSRHYRHWSQTFADETGYLGAPNQLQMRLDLCRRVGLGEEDIRRYTPLPETIAMAFTTLYHVRRSYEEGLALFGYAGARVAGGTGHARTLYEGLERHYGVELRDVAVRSPTRAGQGSEAESLFRLVATTRVVQDRCREAIRNSLLVAEARVRAMNCWVA